MRHAVAQQRIGEEADTVEVDEDGRVPDVLDACHTGCCRGSDPWV
jgi:hypothetical protein